MHATGASASRTALVEILPNGVTGALHTPPALAADFRLMDVVFLTGGTGPDDGLVTAAVRAALAGTVADTAVLMTASKDLCARYAVRAAAQQPPLAARGGPGRPARACLRGRAFAGSPLTGQLRLFRLTVLLLAEAARDSGPTAFGRRHRWIARQYARHRVPTHPSETD